MINFSFVTYTYDCEPMFSLFVVISVYIATLYQLQVKFIFQFIFSEKH